MKKIYVFIALLMAVVTLVAQPQGYYNGTDGLTGDELKAALHNIIKNDDHVSYNGMWTAYQTTDKRPGTNYVWDIYSDVPNGTPPYLFTFSTDQCGSYQGEGDCYNREHLWAQSWTNNDGTHKTDLHHVYPTDGFVNGKRSDYAFGEVRNATWTSENGSKLGSCRTSGFNGTVFEPIDEYKGDIARALMYVSVRYYQEDSDWDNSDMTNKSVIKDWAMTMLLRWHENDPVSEKEINRNNAVYGKQNNRNPFVDNPEFAEMIWDPNWTHHYYVISVAANPSIAGTVSGAGTYEEGQSCTLTATANWGYSFVNWTRNGVVVSNSEVYSFTVTSEATYQANFEINTYEISVAANPEEGGEVFIEGGSKANITQTASVVFSDIYSTTQVLTDIDIALDDNVSVMFGKGTGGTAPTYYENGKSVRCYGGNYFEVSTANGSINSITMTYGSGGGSNTITTEPDTWNGTTWTGDSDLVTFTVGGSSGHRRISGIEVIYTIEDSPTQQGTFTYGSTAVITATPNDGYDFVNWTKNDQVVSTDDTYSFTVTEDATYIANFVEHEDYIEFADANVEAICVANWDTNGSGKLSYEEAAAVTSLGVVFKNNQNIVSFDELQYFTGVTEISNYAFSGCDSLTSIELPNTVISIGNNAFYNCTNLITINLPNTLTSIGNNTFNYCSALNGINLGNSVTTIGGAAFAYCTGLTTIEIPNSVNYIGPGAFGACSSLSQIIVEEGNTVYDSRDDSNAIIQTATNEILFGCMNTVIPNSVTSIGDSAFGYCTGLNSITIPNSITSIGDNAFANCINLVSITSLNDDMPPYIGDMAFYNVPSTAIVYIPCGTYYSYWNYPGWDYFSNFEEINCATQTIAFAAGWNWVSLNVEVTLDDLKAALVEALPGTSITIKSQTEKTTYSPATQRWSGKINNWDLSRMYKIKTATSCEITLEGASVDPSEHPITINSGANWIAYPFSTSMTVTDAFSGFVVNGDRIKSQTKKTQFTNGRWQGQLNTLEPGRGYIYNSSVSEDRTFVFPVNAF
jgi:endonuclease I